MNEMQIINIQGIDCYEKDGSAYLKLETVARGLGFVDYKNGVEYIRWNYVFSILNKLNFSQRVAKDMYIPENIFYRLAMKAKNAVAEAFQAKVADEIIPAIRKTGGYIAGSESMTNEELMAKALIVAQNTINQREERIKALEQNNAVLESKIEADKPKVEFAEALETSTNSITVKQLSVLLAQRGCKTGEKRLFNELREDGFLLSYGNYYNEPAQRYMDMKLFEVKTGTYTTSYGETRNSRQTLITPKGLQYLMDYYMRKYGKMPLLTTAKRRMV